MQAQENGFPAFFRRGASHLPYQAGIQKLLYDGGDGGLGKSQVFGERRTGNGAFIDDGF